MPTAPRIPAPRVTAAALAAAATRLLGTVVLDVADRLVGPAVYLPRLAAFQTVDGEDLGDDDGTLVVLVAPGVAADLIAEHGTPGRAAAVVNRELRDELRAYADGGAA
jgi:hypothetical protein